MARQPFNRIWTEDPVSEDFAEPDDIFWREGWRGGEDQDPPEAYAQNWWQNRADEFMRGIERHGAPEWHDEAEYLVGSASYGSDGNSYISVSGSEGSPNVGNDPTVDDGTNWGRGGLEISSDSVLGLLKTATSGQIASGDMGPLAVVAAELTRGLDLDLSEDGVIKLPDWMGGLTIQWGERSSPEGEAIIQTNRPFEESFYQVLISDRGAADVQTYASEPNDLESFVVRRSGAGGGSFTFLCFGI